MKEMLLLEHKTNKRKKFRIRADKFETWANYHNIGDYLVTQFAVIGNLYMFGQRC